MAVKINESTPYKALKKRGGGGGKLNIAEQSSLFNTDEYKTESHLLTTVPVPAVAKKRGKKNKFEAVELQTSVYDVAPIIKTLHKWPTIYRSENDFFRLLDKRLADGFDTGFDIETDGKVPTILGIGWYDHNESLGECVSIQFTRSAAIRTIRATIEAGRQLVGHNVITADKPWCEKYLGIKTRLSDWYDTMLTHYAANPHLCRTPKKEVDEDNDLIEGGGAMGFMNLWSAVRCLPLNIKNWKECKGAMCDIYKDPCPKHSIFEYNAVDAWAGSALKYFHDAYFSLNEVPQKFIEHVHKTAEIGWLMQRYGVRVDRAVVDKFDENWTALLKQWESILPFNPRSSDQVLNYFANLMKNVPVAERYKLPDTQKDTIKKVLDTLEESVPGYKELETLFHIKAGGKGSASWFSDHYFKPFEDLSGKELEGRFVDGRYTYIHPRWNGTGTATLRYSSSNPNAQNIPSKGALAPLRDAFVARPGYDIVKADARQLELRILTYAHGLDNATCVSGDPFTDLVKVGNGAFEETADRLNSDPSASRLWKPRDVAKSVAHGCLLPDAEVYTRDGWEKIVDVPSTKEIAVWCEGAIKFEVPRQKFIYAVDEELITLRGNAINCTFTANHKMPTTNRKSNIVHKYEVAKLPPTHSLFLTGTLDNDDYPISDDNIKRAVAIQADGSLSGKKARFRLKRFNKISRARQLFPDAEFKWRDNVCEFSVPNVAELITAGKNFDRKILQFSLRQRLLFINELFLWDGAPSKNGGGIYRNTKLNDINLVAEVAMLSGLSYNISNCGPGGFSGSTKSSYSIYISEQHKLARIDSLRKTTLSYKGNVYCFETSTGYFMCRSNGRVFVSGNSTNGEGLETATPEYLNSPNMKRLADKGAIRVFWDWCLGNEIVYSTGANLARRIYGNKKDESRKRALELLFDNYYAKMFPYIPQWHRNVSYDVYRTNAVRGLLGNILQLDYAEVKENMKAAFSVITQGGGAAFMRGKMVEDYEKNGNVWLMMVHDEMVAEVPSDWSNEQVKERCAFLETESLLLPGLVIPFEIKRGPSWFRTQVI